MTSFSSSSRATPPHPRRGEVWLADLDPVRGHEQADRRPVLVVSSDGQNRGPSGLVLVLPISSRIRDIPTHVLLRPPDGGLAWDSMALCEQIRAIAVERLLRPIGALARPALRAIEAELRRLLSL